MSGFGHLADRQSIGDAVDGSDALPGWLKVVLATQRGEVELHGKVQAALNNTVVNQFTNYKIKHHKRSNLHMAF